MKKKKIFAGFFGNKWSFFYAKTLIFLCLVFGYLFSLCLCFQRHVVFTSSLKSGDGIKQFDIFVIIFDNTEIIN